MLKKLSPAASVVAVSVAYLAAIGLGLGLPRVPWSEIAGEKAPIEVFALFLTPLGALAAIVGLLLNAAASRKGMDLTRSIQISSNFQKAAEMLGSKAKSSQTAAIEVLRQVAKQSPATFFSAVLSTLARFAEEGSEAAYLETFESVTKDRKTTGAMNNSVVMTSISTISRLVSGQYARSMVPDDRARVSPAINRILICNFNTSGASLSRLKLHNVFLHRATFRDLEVVDAGLTGFVGYAVTFRGCRFAHCEMRFEDVGGRPLEPTDTNLLQFVGCKFDDETRINGMSLGTWTSLAVGGPKQESPVDVVAESDPITAPEPTMPPARTPRRAPSKREAKAAKSDQAPTRTRSLRSRPSPSGGT